MDERITPQRSKSIDIIITLLVLIAMSIFYYGMRVLIVAAYAIICSIVADYLSVRIIGAKRWLMNDFSQITTALILVCLLPASVPYWLVAAACIIAVLFAKLPFGGYGKNIFNPAAVAYAFVAICWPSKVLLYPEPFALLPLKSDIVNNLVEAPARTLSMGGVPHLDIQDAILGNFAGPAGASCVFVILMCGLYMIVRKTISWRTVLTSLFTVVFISAVFPRTAADTGVSIINELFSGVMVFVLIFMANDPVTSPRKNAGKVLYGFILGTTIMMFRYYGSSEVASVYALIFLNVFKTKFDIWGTAIPMLIKKYFHLSIEKIFNKKIKKGEV